ncbi:MAG: type II toxin-antitoxin system RelE/ParE family toxin [Bacteroidales bacterium]|jgi:plasmid stabilization system protein ParE|nr:type II toxin-antitoxin system RelE/ParE family toxin [Bacteroidales bacterium]
MNWEIKLSGRAMKKLDNLLVFLEKEWSTKVKNDFILKLNKSLKQIQKLPDSFPESEKIRGLRKCVVTKQTTIFYKYSDKTIDIVAIFDNRQDPKSLIQETKA